MNLDQDLLHCGEVNRRSFRTKRMTKRLFGLFLLFFTATTFATGTLPSPTSSVEPIDQVVAVVNDAIITQSQVDAAYKNAVRQIKLRKIKMPDQSTIKNEIINQLIYQELQLQVAQRNQLHITDEQITEAINHIAKQHKISVASLKQKLKEQKTSYATYRKEIKKQMLMSMIQHQALAKEVDVSDVEIDALLDKYKSQGKYATQYHLIDIVIPLPSTPTNAQQKQAKKQALQIINALHRGADTDSVKGAEINDLDWRTKVALPDIFLQPLSKMKPGSIAGPFAAPNGYHILKLVNTKKENAKPPTRNQAKSILMEQKFQKALRKWLIKLRQQSYVDIVHPQ